MTINENTTTIKTVSLLNKCIHFLEKKLTYPKQLNISVKIAKIFF